MPTISLTDPTNGTTADANLIANNNDALESAINGALDETNFASGKIYTPSKLKQASATDGQVLAWSAANAQWEPANAASPTIGTSLPGSPSDGDEAILVDSLTAPTYAWRFVYDAGISDANKWLFIGGSPYISVNTADETTGLGTTYADTATVGPSLTVPRSGIYTLRIGAAAYGPGNATLWMSYSLNGAAAADADGVTVGIYGESQSNSYRVDTKTLTATHTLVAKYRMEVAQTAQTWFHRTMSLTPVRVA